MSQVPNAEEPIAVVGIGCRLPGGVTGPESLWNLLDGKRDAIGPIRDDRRDVERFCSAKSQQPGRMSAREGGFLALGAWHIPFDELDEDMLLMDCLDSLLAVEISSWLERELSAKVTIIELMKGPSVAQLTEQLLARLGDGRTAPPPQREPVDPPTLAKAG
jgi:aryl carrier-like protein